MYTWKLSEERERIRQEEYRIRQEERADEIRRENHRFNLQMQMMMVMMKPQVIVVPIAIPSPGSFILSCWTKDLNALFILATLVVLRLIWLVVSVSEYRGTRQCL